MRDGIDEQLVRQIVEQVLEVVRREQGQVERTEPTPAPAHLQGEASGAARARVRPPAGVCTGDYSKFAELSGRSIGGALPATDNGDRPGAMGSHSPIALTGIVTAQQLQEAIDATPDGVARLAHDARLTPLANDFARQHPDKIRRVGRASAVEGRASASAGGSADGSDGASGAAGPWLWWADGHCPAVQALTRRLGARLRPSAMPRSESGLAQVIADLADAVESGKVQGGLLFVRSGARVTCFANRCRSLRAVVGTCVESVEQAIGELGANVLIVEYPHLGAQAIEAVVQRMIELKPTLPADVQRHLNELQRRR